MTDRDSRLNVLSMDPTKLILDRLDRERESSDTALCDSLLKACEFAIRHSTAILVASLPGSQEAGSLRYRMEYRLIRAASIGEWTRALSELLVGPNLAQLNGRYRFSGSQDGLSRLVKKLDNRDSKDSWAINFSSGVSKALEHLEEVPSQKGGAPKFVSALNQFSHLRNKMDAHGAPTAAIKGEVAAILNSAVYELLTNLQTLKIPMVKISNPKALRLNGVVAHDVVGAASELVSEKVNGEYPNIVHEDGLYVAIQTEGPSVEIERINLIESSPELSDFFYANGGFNEQTHKAEFLNFVSSKKKLRNCSKWSGPPLGLPASVTSGSRDLRFEGKAITNLPKHISGYVHRESLERALEQELTAPNRHIVTLKGLGGIGKTSLALEVATQCAEKGLFDLIIWASARDLDLGETSSKPVKPDVETLEDLARNNYVLFSQLGDHTEGNVIEWFTSLLQSDKHGKVLWILDNFETIRAPEETVQFFANSLHPQNRVLITTRHRDYQGDYSIPVSGMEGAEFKELVNACARIHGISIDEKRIEKIHMECEGHPYIAKLHVAELRANPAASIRTTLNKEKIQEDLLERTYLRLDEDSKRVFLLLCTYKSVIYRLALKLAVADQDLVSRNIDDTLEELVSNSLVFSFSGVDGSYVSVPPIARSFGDRKLNASDEKLAIDAMAAVLRLFEPITLIDAKSRPIGDLSNRGFLMKFFKKAIDTANPQLRKSYLELLGIAADHHPVIWDWLSDFHKEEGDLKAAIDALKRKIELGGEQENAEAHKALALLYRQAEPQRPYLEVQAWVRRAETPGLSLKDVHATANRVNSFLKDKPAISDLERRSLVAPMVEVLEQRFSECNADQLSALAHLLRRLKRDDRARDVAEAGLLIDPDNRHCRKFLHLD